MSTRGWRERTSRWGWARCLQITGSVGIDRGYAPVDLPHPLSAAAFGTDVVAQWLVFDPASQAYAATQMHAIRLP